MADSTDDVDTSHEYDELMGPPEISKHQSANNGSDIGKNVNYDGNAEGVRTINLILDSSAFTRGIGNIKRWYTQDYINQRGQKIRKNHTVVNLHIPSYTLRDFDHLKKGSSMIAIYVRQSIRFIDQLFENNQNSTNVTPFFTINLNIEAPGERGPPWNECRTYQIHQPKVREFPNLKTNFDVSMFGRRQNTYDGLPGGNSTSGTNDQYDNRLNDIQYENSRAYLEAAANADKFAVMPPRLKYLISSCVYKKFNNTNNFNDPLEEWKLITEDPITNIWVRSYGIDCMNVNEAELLMFQSYDVNRLYNPHQSFSLDDEVHHNSILQDTIDTTLYSYTKLDKPNKHNNQSRRGGNKSDKEKVKGVTNRTKSDISGETISMERFDSINYAPRGTGKLWKP